MTAATPVTLWVDPICAALRLGHTVVAAAHCPGCVELKRARPQELVLR